jgi:hypothetical protein
MNVLLYFYNFILGSFGVLCLFHSVGYLCDLIDRIFLFWNPVKDANEPTKTETERILEKRAQQLNDSFADDTRNYNENIDPVVYNREQYDALMQQGDTELEKVWSKRILMEMTPRGNCIMKYNIYKHSFEYYSDGYMPYDVLNALAMKYVLIYRCRDFFVDEHYLSETHTSGLTESVKKYEEAKKQKQKQKQKQENADKNNAPSTKLSGPFLRSKAASLAKENKEKEGEVNKPDEKKTVDKTINKFSYMGKLVNFSMLVKQKPVHHMNGFKTELLDCGKLSYEEYKKRKMLTQK